ncbi:MAG: ATP-dependent DNA ligase [Paracoccaceae bacterium]|nr:MAG: ATP-dependent DNA ligase [Paracoccaceae bacterium]
MKRFTKLFAALDGTTRTGTRTEALAAYFRTAPESDRLWCAALLSGRRPKRAVNATELRLWAAQAAAIPDWLMEESYAVAGDLAETITLLLPPPSRSEDHSLTHWIQFLIGLTGQPVETRRAAILGAWDGLGGAERFLFIKLLTGGFRMGVSRGLMTRALAMATGRAEADIAHRLMGDWHPDHITWAQLLDATATSGGTRPYPFALASPLEDPPDSLGPPADWSAEWKWDGIRGQIVARADAFAVWSRGEELMTDRFPEFALLSSMLPHGTVIDGEILAWNRAAARPQPFAALQRRIGRKTLSRQLLAETPVHFLAYDLLEDAGADLRATPFHARRSRLTALLAALPAAAPVSISPDIPFESWDDLASLRRGSRDRQAEGLMLKRALSPYFTGRRRGDWWKWKIDPYTVDAVMLYAQAGHGRRATLYTDFTFGLRDGDTFVPFTKAYSGLTDAEFAEITAWVRANTLERFGPVRRVTPHLVFELAFEGIQDSPRHKSGIALRFPRMLRWRRDKPVAEIDTLDSLRGLLRAHREN